MRILCTALALLILCPLAGTVRADGQSDCLSSCAGAKRANDMYCPPAGGYSEEEHKQCLEKNSDTYNECAKACSPAAPPPEPPAEPSQAEPPPAAAPEPPPDTAVPPPA